MTTPPEAARDANAFVATAMEALNRGDLDLAEVHCRQALAMEPKHIGALAVLGGVLHGLARFREAESLFADLTERAPGTASFWMNLGTVRRATGKLDAALAAYARAAELGEKSADFLFNLGLTHLERLDPEAARSLLAQAMTLAPADAEIRLEYARACEMLGLSDEAVAALLGSQTDGTLAPNLRARIALQLLHLGEAGTALRMAERLATQWAPPTTGGALQHQTTNATTSGGVLEPHAALTLAQLYERLNRVEEARSLLGRIKSDPGTLAQGVVLPSTEARLLQRGGQHEEAVSLLRRELGWRRDLRLRQTSLFRLAASLDALGRHDEALEALRQAHQTQLSNAHINSPLVTLQATKPLRFARRSADADDVSRWREESAPSSAESPIFVVGLPRSGKILVEMMLDAHPDLVASGGRPLLQHALKAWAALGDVYPQSLATLGDKSLAAARDKYRQAARHGLRIGAGQRIVDTDPMNLLQLPAIRRLFPNAPIVLVARHPCDALLSAYFQEFATTELMTMAASLQTLAFSYDIAMSHWSRQREILAPRVHEIPYERLVADFSDEAGALCAALELSWNDAMARPDEHARGRGYVPGASYAEVVRPVAASAVGKWRSYSKHFAPILPQLKAHAARWRYSLE